MAETPDYDVMADEPADDSPPDSESGSGGKLDPELLMHAEAAGLDEAKAEALKLFVERCMELKGEGSYEDGAGAEDDTEPDE